MTWLTPRANGNFDMQDSIIETTSFLQLHRLWRRQPFLILTVRQFTDRIDNGSGLPIKWLHAFRVTRQGVCKLSAQEVEWAQNTDFTTGQPLPREVAVEYC